MFERITLVKSSRVLMLSCPVRRCRKHSVVRLLLLLLLEQMKLGGRLMVRRQGILVIYALRHIGLKMG